MIRTEEDYIEINFNTVKVRLDVKNKLIFQTWEMYR